jgi:hypothetical protein
MKRIAALILLVLALLLTAWSADAEAERVYLPAVISPGMYCSGQPVPPYCEVYQCP